MTFRLRVQKIEQICLFELTWGQGQQLTASLSYPSLVIEQYQEWQRVYLGFYQRMDLLPIHPPTPDPPLRGWTIAGGRLTPAPVDWHARLVEAETRLLNEFHRWLRSAELFEIRAAIARASRAVAVAERSQGHPHIAVFLTCTPLELARLPWEAWEIGADFAATGTIHIIRTPANIQGEIANSTARRGRARILAILGDQTGLNFQGDREAVQSLARLAEVTFVGWQPGQTATEVKEQIRLAIANPQGWDLLFFAGHSNETAITGGELAIAPQVSIAIRDITPHLIAAKERGLQVAIFNSCSGLNIAESLIGLGFSQVAVMREPIHNRVAQEFLVQFLRSLADHKDVHEALLSACQSLRLEKNLTYPSAYLVPSLFCHPGAALFRIQPQRWTRWLQPLRPTGAEAIALTAALALSLFPPVQATLQDGRIWVQAVYRDATGQVPAAAKPPVALVQIDAASISRDGVSQVHPIDRRYLAALVDQLVARQAQVIGIDFVLDTPQPGDAALSQSVQTAVAKQHTWFVFAAILDPSGEIGIPENSPIARRTWSLQGYIDADPAYVMLPYPAEDCQQTCPFAYLLALTHLAHRQRDRASLPYPRLDRELDLRSQLLQTIDAQPAQPHSLTALRQLHLSAISVWAYEQWGQHWLEPMIDFSLPSDRVYSQIPAWRLLATAQGAEAAQLSQLSQQIVIIAPGADERTGLAPGAPDRFPAPAALNYWSPQNWLTGGEALAYMIHHQLTRRLVIPIPDLWLVGIAGLLGRAAVVLLRRRSQQPIRQRQMIASVAAALALYGVAGLQLYISAAILLPWLLPAATVWVYILLALRKPTDDA